MSNKNSERFCLIYILSVVIEATAHLPFQAESDCFINVAGMKPHPFPWELMLTRLYSQTGNAWSFTTYELHQLDFKVISDNATLKEGYFRFYLKLRVPCAVFLLQPWSFKDAVKAIDNSGFGNTDDVVFFIYTASGSLIRTFSRDLTTSLLLQWVPSFHAPVVFFDGFSPFVLQLCYFCGMQILSTASPGLSAILNLHQEVNGQGHGLTYFSMPVANNDGYYQCFGQFTLAKFTMEAKLAAIKRCNGYGVFLGPLQHKVNFSFFTPSTRNFILNLPNQITKMRWLIKGKPENTIVHTHLLLIHADRIKEGTGIDVYWDQLSDFILNPISSFYPQDRGYLHDISYTFGDIMNELLVCSEINTEA